MGLLKWSIALAIAAAIFAVFGFTGIAEGFADIAKVLFAIFVIGFLLFIVLGTLLLKKIF